MQRAKKIGSNPFPGLRPFGIDEGHLFFGREGQSETVLTYLANYKFAAITGASGSGKSSLMYCGVIPLLHGGFITQAGSKWNVVATRPGSTPVWNLAKSLVNSSEVALDADEAELQAEYYYAALKRHSYGLVEAIEQLGLIKDKNLLIVVDQFEELFRYKKSKNPTESHIDETEFLISLLVNTVQKLDLPVYIVITMRSDFIGECSEYQNLTALINKSNYLVPQMTRADFELVIRGPLRVAGIDIEPRLLQHILNSLDESRDQLPVLQHTMMRTWSFWRKHNDFEVPLSMRDYMAAGRLENALSLHANEAYIELDDKQRQLCRQIFKALTERGRENKGIRRPVTVRELVELTQSPQSEVLKVIEVFRKEGRSFLMPNQEIGLNAESVIDISHESLMRVWDKLVGWVEEEVASSQMYLRLIELANIYQMGRTGLMQQPDLQLAINWKKSQLPNRAWARRYNPAFEKAMVYLNTSERKHQADEESKIKLRRRELNRTRRYAILMSVFAVVLLMAVFYAYLQRETVIQQKERVEQYAKILEAQKDTALEISELREYELLQERDLVDSLSKYQEMQQMQLIQKAGKEQDYQERLEEMSQVTEELERLARTEREGKQQAESQARIAQQDRSQLEAERRVEKQKRIQLLAQSLALKSTQTDDYQLSGLLACQAFLLNRENGGQIAHPDIYTGLTKALGRLKGQKFNTLKGHAGGVNSLVFDPARNILYSADNTGVILKWGFRRESPKATQLMKNEQSNTCLDITVDGRWMASGTEVGEVQLFNVMQPGQSPRIFNAHEGSVTNLKFIPGRNSMVTTGIDNKVKFWDLLTNEGTVIYENPAGINDIDVSPKGENVYFATTNGQIMQWGVGNKKPTLLYRQEQPIMTIACDHEGEKIAFGDRTGKLYVINTANAKLVKRVNAHTARIIDIEFSPDNRHIASSGLDGIVRIWNSTDWNDLPLEIREQESWVETMAFSPDGKSLISTSNNGSLIYIWPIKTENLVEELCRYLKRQLSSEEWNFYIGKEIEYREVCK